MELQKPKIALYVKRSFGEKLNVTIDFLRENWKIVLKFVTYLLLPVSLVQAVFMNGLMGGMMSFSGLAMQDGTYPAGFASGMTQFILHYCLFILVAIIGTVIIQSLIYAMMRLYREREEGLQGATLGMLKPLLLHNIKRIAIIVFFMILLSIIAIIIISFLTYISGLTLLITIPLGFAIVIPLTLLIPIYLFEDIPFLEAFMKAFRLGFPTWGGTFLIILITSLIGSILQTLTTLPWYIMTIVKYVFAATGESAVTVTSSFGYSIALYLLGIVQAFGSYLAMVIVIIGLGYQYGHASELMDNVTVESDIDNFDKL